MPGLAVCIESRITSSLGDYLFMRSDFGRRQSFQLSYDDDVRTLENENDCQRCSSKVTLMELDEMRIS